MPLRCQQQEGEGRQGMRYETAWFLVRSRTHFSVRESAELHFSLFGVDLKRKLGLIEQDGVEVFNEAGLGSLG